MYLQGFFFHWVKRPENTVSASISWNHTISSSSAPRYETRSCLTSAAEPVTKSDCVPKSTFYGVETEEQEEKREKVIGSGSRSKLHLFKRKHKRTWSFLTSGKWILRISGAVASSTSSRMSSKRTELMLLWCTNRRASGTQQPQGSSPTNRFQVTADNLETEQAEEKTIFSISFSSTGVSLWGKSMTATPIPCSLQNGRIIWSSCWSGSHSIHR